MIQLKKSDRYKIMVVGVGGTGSHLVSFLTQLIGNNKSLKLKTNIVLIDEDIVEEHNLKTQKFLIDDIYKNKAEVLADRYNSVFDLEIKYVDQYITKENDIYNIISRDRMINSSEKIIIVGCVDNNKARRILTDAFKNINIHRDIIYIDAGNSSGSEELCGQAIVAFREGGIPRLPTPDNYFSLEDEVVKEISCGERLASEIQNIGANITSACTIFNILNNILSFNVIPGDVFTFNASSLESSNIKVNGDKFKNNTFLSDISKK